MSLIKSLMTTISLGAWLAIGAWPLSTHAQSVPINLNTADAATIAKTMDGVGQSKAQAIVDYRTKNGPFRSVDDLALVKGIGKRTIDLNRAKLAVGAAPATVRKPAGAEPAEKALAKPAKPITPK